jgi:uncharacterized coiled-coil protein SlyX
MNWRELLQAVNSIGVKGLIPIIGPYLGEVIERGLNIGFDAVDEARLEQRLLELATRQSGQQTAIDYLVKALAQPGLVQPALRSPLEELAHALRNPDNPPSHVKEAFDRLGQIMGNLRSSLGPRLNFGTSRAACTWSSIASLRSNTAPDRGTKASEILNCLGRLSRPVTPIQFNSIQRTTTRRS